MQYEQIDYAAYRREPMDTPELMANFVATITRETRFVDGLTTKSVLTIRGEMGIKEDGFEGEQGKYKPDPLLLPEIEVDTESFAGLSWVVPNWGVRCVIRPGTGIKDDLRTMIQLKSSPEIRTVYKQTGWTIIDGRRTYLHVGGGISKSGNRTSIEVRMPPELNLYNLTTEVGASEGFIATLALISLGRADLTWPLLAATLAPMYGAVDFAVHLTGRTGSFKSEVMSLFQSCYGAGMDARKLPGSWSSTPNALEALAFYAANAAFVIDDFVPSGTSWQQRAYQQNADKIIRSQGNQAGRARLSDTSSLQQTMYPRGIILSTGEDTPEGHSIRARMLILEVSAGEIATTELSKAQANRPRFIANTAWLAQSLAETEPAIALRAEELRTAYRAIGHTRTPGMIGRLVAVIEDWLARGEAAGFIGERERKSRQKAAKSAIEEAGGKQMQYLEDSDPVDMFAGAIRQALSAGNGHIRTLNGGVPVNATILGWTSETASGEMATYKARGPCIGWCSIKADELYIDAMNGYSVIRKVAGVELSLSKQTLFKRMKDAGACVRIDDGRQRNTIRVTAEGHPRQVLCLSLSTTLDVSEVKDGS